MDAVFNLIAQYGAWVYALLFLYCGIKSGALPLFAGYAAAQGALGPVPVTIASFMGGYLGDELRFWWARRFGIAALARRPRIARVYQKAAAMFDRYGPWYIFLYRYPKGLRTIGALPVGLGRMRWLPFSLLNAASAAIWAVALVGAGFFLGEAIAETAAQNWGFVSVGLLAAVIGVAAILAWRLNRTTPHNTARP